MCNLQILLTDSETLLNCTVLNSTLCKPYNVPDVLASQHVKY